MTEKRKESIKRLLIRYIRDHNLAKGMKLPGQTELRTMFGCGVTTLTSAIHELCAERMVETRDKVGVYVLNAAASGTKGRRIGVITGSISGSPYYAFLNMYLEETLSRSDCSTIWFHQDEYSYEKVRNGFKDIPGLKQAVDSDGLDGVFSTIYCTEEVERYLEKHCIKLVYLSANFPENNAIMIDNGGMVEKSVHHLHSLGYARIELVTTERFGFAADSFMKAMDECRLPVSKENIHYKGFGDANSDNYIAWLDDIFRKWVELPLERRPDALIILDDMIACRLYFYLLQANIEWRPRLVTVNNLNINIPFDRNHTDYWELDIREFVKFAVAQFIEMVQNGNDALKERLFLPKFIQCASHDGVPL